MSRVNARLAPNKNKDLKPYSPPRLTKLDFSVEQIAQIEAADDRLAEFTRIYREYKGR